MRDHKESSPFTTNRRGFMRLVGVAGISYLAVSHMGTLRALADCNESAADIINIAATAEALAVTLTGAVIAGASKYDNGKGLPDMLVRWVKGIQAEEKAHYDYLVGAGAKQLTLTFTVPQNLAGITTDSKQLLDFVVAAETIFIGAYIAAAEEFTQMKQPDLAQVALQIAGVESEHRVLANYGRGKMPPNDLAFEHAPYTSVGQAAAAVKNLGLLGTDNPAATLTFNNFANSVDFSGVSNLKP